LFLASAGFVFLDQKKDALQQRRHNFNQIVSDGIL